MRRAGVIVALDALQGMLGGVVTAAPAFAGAGRRMAGPPLPPTFTEPGDHCGFPIQGTQDIVNIFTKVLKTADGSTIFLSTGGNHC